MVNKKYEKNPFNFIKIYNFMRDELELKGLELEIYAYIFSKIEIYNNNEISYGELANYFHSSREVIIRTLRKLIEKELVKKEKDKINSYGIYLNNVLIKNQQTLNQMVTKNHQEWYQKVTRCADKKSAEVVTKNQHIKDIKNIKEYKDKDLLSETISHIDNDNLSNNYISDDSDSTELADDELPF